MRELPHPLATFPGLSLTAAPVKAIGLGLCTAGPHGGWATFDLGQRAVESHAALLRELRLRGPEGQRAQIALSAVLHQQGCSVSFVGRAGTGWCRREQTSLSSIQ